MLLETQQNALPMIQHRPRLDDTLIARQTRRCELLSRMLSIDRR